MNTQDPEFSKKVAAEARSRQVAIAAIVPRILGAIEISGQVAKYKDMWTTILVVDEGNFSLVGALDGENVYFQVRWAGQKVMAGHVCSDAGGLYLDRRVALTLWKRGPWQAALFDTFPTDSSRFLETEVAYPQSPLALEFLDFLHALPDNRRGRAGDG